MFDIVVAVDLDWGIGKAGGLPWPKLRGDMRHFRRVTSTASPGLRNAVVMGRKTWESAEVAGQPLPGRLNVVVTRGALTVPDGVIVAATPDDALVDRPGIETIFVVGGAGLVRDVIERGDLRHVYLTRIEGRYGCDVILPDLDARGLVRDAWDGAFEAEDAGVRYRVERLRRP